MSVTQVLAQIREAERAAHERLERGCRQDIASLPYLIAGSLRKARGELLERIVAMGSLDPMLRRNLLVQEAEEVALRWARLSFANADIRFRARFKMYGTDLADEYERYLERAPRRITAPHLLLEDERSVIPDCEVSLSSIDEWVDELKGRVRLALEDEAGRAYRQTVERGARSLARARIAIRLEAHGRASRPA